MRGIKRGIATCLSLLALGVLGVSAPAAAQDDNARYALAGGCYALKSEALGRFVARSAGGGYSASAGQAAEAEPFRMQATDLGKYLFFGKASDFMAGGGGVLPGGAESVQTATEPSPAADWRVDVAGSAFKVFLPSREKVLSASGDSGQLVLSEEGAAAERALFSFQAVDGCANYPEVETGATGTPLGGPSPYSEVDGYVDAHLHLMAFEFLGGSVRCGRPWHPYGVTHAMVDCPDHGPGGTGAALENTLSYKNSARTHDTTGWPTFKDWPHWQSLTHEQIYYKFLERAYLGGLRLFVNLLVDNAVLCEVYPIKRNPCDEMNTARLELERTYELQDYIDAQHGGPGKGWFRVVDNPFEARRVISEGKLAVVIGIEVSRLFGCSVHNDVPECDRAQIDRELDQWYDRGVRSLELVNKFDNALSGVAGDTGDTGTVVNAGNWYETGRFWQMQTCEGEAHDRQQHTGPGAHNDDALTQLYHMFAPPGATPEYPDPPHCNTRGLSELGEHLVRGMMRKGMILDPDHMSVLGRNQALALAESRDYSGVISSHSWSDDTAIPRIYGLGGVVTPYAGSSTTFVETWRKWKPMYSGQQYFGFGYGADTNGFGAQGPPREGNQSNPVTYPFKSFDGAVTLERQRGGERVWDINADGVAHYGLYADWIEDLRRIAGDEIVNDMTRGAEAYLQMWERATGIPAAHCRSQRARFNPNGLGRVRLGVSHRQLLRSAGQPARRGVRTWAWCVSGKKAKVKAVLTPRTRVGLVGSRAPAHRALRIGRGERAGRVRADARPFGRGVQVRSAGGGRKFVYVVRKGRVRGVAVATRAAAKSRPRLRSYLRRAGLL